MASSPNFYVTLYSRVGALGGNVMDQYLGSKGGIVNKNGACKRIVGDKRSARTIVFFWTKKNYYLTIRQL